MRHSPLLPLVRSDELGVHARKVVVDVVRLGHVGFLEPAVRVATGVWGTR